MNKFVFTYLLAIVSYMLNAQDLCQPVGWATQNGGVTGGGNATPVVVSNYDDLKAKVTSSTDKVIHISGTITIPIGGRINPKDLTGKTIFGLPGSKIVSTDMSASGSGIFYMTRCTNFIMRNLVFEGPGAYDTDGYDNLCIDNCQNIWVDHCEFHDGMDGNFDFKNMSNYISVTWCTFSYEKPPKPDGPGGADDHRYTNLIGSSDGATADEGKLCITFQYCWWGEGCKERMPRIRFGKIHLVNNLFSSSVSNHCIRAGYKADIVAEGNYFDNQKLPIDEYEKNYTAIKGVNNYGASDLIKNTAFAPPYSISVATASSVKTVVQNCAGAVLTGPTACSTCGGGTANQPPVVSLTSPTNNQTYNTPATVSLAATATDADGTISKVEFYNGTTLLGSDNTSPYTYTWNQSSTGTYTLKAVTTDNSGATTTSSTVTIIVSNPQLPTLVATGVTTQQVDSGTAISSIVYTWGGAATDVTYSTLPTGINAVKNSNAKTLTISGTPEQGGTITVSTVGGSPVVTGTVTITLKAPSSSSILADWYPFQESTISLPFVSFTDASVSTTYYDTTKPNNGVAYTPGALGLNKAVGTMILTLSSLEELALRWYATGGRTLQITYGATGTENTWTSPVQYESGAHEMYLTDMIPELVSSSPIIIKIINNRTDGGSLNIHDLFVRGTASGVITSVEEQERNWIVYPNPATSVIRIQNSVVSSQKTVEIFNSLGQTVFSTDYRSLTSDYFSIDISSFPSGLYFVKSGNQVQKFVKQ